MNIFKVTLKDGEVIFIKSRCETDVWAVWGKDAVSVIQVS